MAKHGKFGEFHSQQESWDAYLERLELYFTANDIVEEEKKRAILLTVCGPTTYKLIRSLVAPKKPAEVPYKDLGPLVKQHLTPKPTVMVARFKFHTRCQQPGESVAVFVSELRQLTENCEFGTFLDEMLRDRLVCGIADSDIQRRMLAEPSLTLQKALDLARAMEMAQKDTKDIHGQQPSLASDAVHAVIPSKQSRGNRQRTADSGDREPQCYRCGGKHFARECPHKEKVCHTCKKQGHLARVCRAAKKGNKRDGKKKRLPPTNQGTHNVKEEVETSGSEDSEDIEGPYTLYPVQSQKIRPIEVEVKVNGACMNMELDTGAAVTIISEQTYEKTWSQDSLPLNPTTIKLRTYTGEELKALGSASVNVEYKGQKQTLPLVVVEGNGPSLLGRNWLLKLQLDWSEIRQLQHVESLQDVLKKHQDVFQEGLGELKDFKAKIHVDQNAQPRFHKARPVPFAMKAKVEQELIRLEKEGIIQPVKFSDWAAPIVPVVKENGDVRICGDYRLTVNQVSKLDAYPLPKVEELFAKLTGGKLFTKLDLKNAYLQLVLDEDSRVYTTINTHRGLFVYNRLPFGIASAPGMFQRTMDTLLQGIPHTVAYLDDVLVTGSSEQDHLHTLDKVLGKLEASGLRLGRSKCVFMTPEVEYLGHKINSEGLHPTSEKIRAIRDAPSPHNTTELKSFLGLLSYYSKFLPNMSQKLAPLYLLLQKNTPWQWGEAQQMAFAAAKKSLQANTLLVHYDPEKELSVSCDASPYGVGAVLSQKMEDGSDKPVAFASRTLAPAEKNYSQLEKEGLSVVFGVKRFHNYIYGRHFTIYSDHKPLQSLFSETKGVPAMAASRIQRWALTLSAYDYTIVYRKGEHHGNADALSRLPLPQQVDVPVPGDLFLLKQHLDSLSPVTSEQISQWTSKDPVLSQVKRFIRHGWPQQKLKDVFTPYVRRRDELSLMDGCILWGSRVVIPKPGREAVTQELHETHPGIVKMKMLARSYVWWPRMSEDLEDTVKCCSRCQVSRATPAVAPLHPWEWPLKPWSRLHLDYAGPMEGKMYLVLVDAHSKWVEVMQVQSATSTVTIEKLRTVFATHGLPEKIVTDNGSVFTSSEFESFMELNGIVHVRSSPYHPASNGLAERAVQLFKHGVKRLKDGSMETRIARFLSKYRLTPHATTGRSPAELLLGRQPRSRLDLLHPETEKKVLKSQTRQKASHDMHCKARSFQIGEHVYVKNFVGTPTWLPAVIIDQLGPVSFRVRLTDGRIRKRHVDHLRIRHTQEERNQPPPVQFSVPAHVSERPQEDVPEPVDSGQSAQEPQQDDVPVENPTPQNSPVLRRSGRVRRQPDRLY